MSKVSKFVQEVVATLKGDDAQVLALKIERKAKSAITSQIAALNASIVDQEDAVDSALSAYYKAKYPTVQIVDGKSYVNGIASAKQILDMEQEKLEQLKDSLDFFTEELKDLF